MKNKIIYIVFLLTSLFIGCKSGDELYLSPNDPVDGTPQTLLTVLQVNTFANVEGELNRLSGILVQHMAGTDNQYVPFQNYNITAGDFDNSWQGLYSGTMQNAYLLINKTKDDNPYYAGIGRVLMAVNLGIATDLWGDVPYSESFKLTEGVKNPVYDSQKSVYASIDALLEQAIADFAKPASANVVEPEDDDLMFSGDMGLWTKAAYTLRARYLHRTSGKVAGTEAKVLQYLTNGISSNSENLEAVHTAVGGTQNQWGAFKNSRKGYIVANKKFVDYLKSRNDPRISYFLTKDSQNDYSGGDITQEQISTSVSTIGDFFATSQNFPIVTFYEAKFIEAEILEKQGDLNAFSVLNDAISASVDYVTKGVGNASPVANYSVANTNLENIMTEKWVAMFGQLEAYNDYRRTKFPSLAPRPSSAGAVRAYIPLRYPTPQNSSLYNPNAKYVELNIPVWWGN
ncbi:SusD/RagB family nutrient-binding outer membrane lipoprotein [Pseudopedobacter beijingensis]|uniref:SusD/RagB family nutrient-binding outer membrane lipoprotein n=1 Tax=Pseudopedobacter beijingensis TaxID=1207056 RepID=A0ABW4IA77_9SPHI